MWWENKTRGEIERATEDKTGTKDTRGVCEVCVRDKSPMANGVYIIYIYYIMRVEK